MAMRVLRNSPSAGRNIYWHKLSEDNLVITFDTEIPLIGNHV